MLVLTRRRQQRIMIGDDIVVTLVDITGTTARIGIDAPPGMNIAREEVQREPKGQAWRGHSAAQMRNSGLR